MQNRPPQIRNRKFTPAEDQRIIELVAESGGSCTQSQWLLLDQELNRQNFSAQLRWKNVLKPRLRTTLRENSFDGSPMPPSFELPIQQIAGSVRYSRQPYSVEEDQRIIQFASARSRDGLNVPWCRLDEELGRTEGAGHNRYLTLVARQTKDILRCVSDEIETTPAKRPRTHDVRVPMSLQYTRVTNYTPEEDALIIATVTEPSSRMTTERWKTLAITLDRPKSWLRYRWELLASKEKEIRAAELATRNEENSREAIC